MHEYALISRVTGDIVCFVWSNLDIDDYEQSVKTWATPISIETLDQNWISEYIGRL